jgi:class 3 adenylate cyclase
MALPAGTVTLLFSDIEGSTRLLEGLGQRCDDVLEAHRRIVPRAVAGHGGHEVRNGRTLQDCKKKGASATPGRAPNGSSKEQVA